MTKGFHKYCFACGKHSPIGLRLQYTLRGDTLMGEFQIPDNYQGYENVVHGGIIATILDCSMVHLFLQRDELVLKTAKLNVTYRKSLPVNENFIVTAVADDSTKHFYKAKAQIKIGDVVFAEAEGFFRG